METEKIIKVIDFWNEFSRSGNLKDRSVLDNINFKTKEITDIIGPRRCGKSSILKLVIKKLNLKNNYIFMNFEDPFFIENKKPLIIEELISVFQQYFNRQLDYLFFDEIQQIDQWEKAIRKLRDLGSYKIFITGSNSGLMESDLSTLLTGRHLSYKIFPLDFKEYLNFKNIRITGNKDLILNKQKILKQFDNFMQTGGFPEIVLTENMELARTYFYDILQKDIIRKYDIRQKLILERIALYMISNSSKIISIESLKNAYDISYELANSYLEYIKSAFLIFDISQFGYSVKKQQKSMKKYYSIDTGMLNAVSYSFSEDRGRILENMVFLALKNSKKQFYYYKTQNNTEIDFVVSENLKITELIQVCWDLSDLKTREREIKSLVYAMKELKLSNSKIITYEQEDEIKIDDKIIHVIPAYKWLLQ